MISLAERIKRGEQAIARAKAEGRDVPEWEAHLELLKQNAELPPRAWVHEAVRDKAGNLRAVKIDSEPLDDQLWLILDKTFQPKDELAIYYPEELPALATKSCDELKLIHKTKLVFPGSRVIQ